MKNNNNKHAVSIPITIIANIDLNVKYGDKTPEKTRKNNTQKWSEKKINNLKIAEKMQCIGELRRAERMKNCGDVLEYTFCKDCGEYHIKKANLCRDRFCPTCSWRLSLQRYGEMKNLMTNIMQAYPEVTEWSLITLTVKNCYIDDLHDTMQKMSRAWNLAITQRHVRPNLFGWARSVEVTFNEDTRQLHPHYHILIGWWNNVSQALVQKWLTSCRKHGLIADIKAQDAQKINYYTDENGIIKEDTEIPENFTKAVLETFKYSIKGSDIEKLNVAEFREIITQYSNKRLIAYGGKIKEYAKKLKTSLETVDEEDSIIRVCANCGSPDIENLIYIWSFGENAYTLKTN